MNSNSQETLRRVTQDDPSLTELILINNNSNHDGDFYADNSGDYSTLGAAIANNTQLEELEVTSSNRIPLGVADREFYDGLKSNSSINNLKLYCSNQNITGEVGQEILEVYQENNNQLTALSILEANLQNGGDRVIGDTLRSCRNLQRITLKDCNITDAQLLPIVDAIRGHHLLETLGLFENNIGNAGCDALATLLTDSNCNLRMLSLGDNAIHNEGATTIANSLTNNYQLQQLYLYGNPIDQTIQDVFSNILCNTANINSLYASNHTLKAFNLGQQLGQQLQSLLRLNEDTIKSHVAIKKILKFHPNIDMEPLFEWDAEGEQTLKALPYIVNWFESAREAIANGVEEYNVEERKLSAIFQLAKAMPLLFEGISHINLDNKNEREKTEVG